MSNEIISGHRVSVDVEQVNRLLTQLNDKDAKKAIKSAIRKSALIIRKRLKTGWFLRYRMRVSQYQRRVRLISH